MSFSLQDELQDAYLNNELIPVIGSGFSVPFHLPDWKQLILGAAAHFQVKADCIKVIQDCLKRYEYLEATDALLEEGVTEEELQIFVADMMTEARKRINAAEIENNYTDLSLMTYSRFLTTNYDEYLNDFTGSPSFFLRELDNMPVNELTRARYRQIVIPIHGVISRPDSIVLSRGSYEKVYGSAEFDRRFQHFREKFTFLFMGFSFDDVYFQRLFEQVIGRFQATHYILFDEKKREDKEKLGRLYKEYNVKPVFYDSSNGHVAAIHQFLDSVIHFRDRDVNLEALDRLHEGKETEKDEEIKGLLEEGKKAREEERLSEMYAIYKGLSERTDFSILKPETRVDILCGIIWYYGMLQEMDTALTYMNRIREDEELCKYAEKSVVLYVQILWNLYQWDEALKLLEEYSQKDKMLPKLLKDVIVLHKYFLTGREKEAGKIPVYEQVERSDSEKEEFRRQYLKFKNTYVNPDTCNLINLRQYETMENQEIAYFWLGIVAGQLFHEHADAIQYLNRALELRHAVVYCEELAFNYLALAEERIRYRQQSFYYELDKQTLMKAERCFRFVMRTEDPVLLRSVYRRCGQAYLRVLFLLKRDFEFEEFYQKAGEELPDHIDLRRMKAECDARFYYRAPSEDDGFEEGEQQYFEMVSQYARAGFYKMQGRLQDSQRLYREILGKAEKYAAPGMERKYLDLMMDAAFFSKDLERYRRYWSFRQEGQQEEGIYPAFEKELEGEVEQAQCLFTAYFERHPDISTFQILNGFYIRQNMRDKSAELFEKAMQLPGLIYHADIFYRDYILCMMQEWKDIDKALELYIRFHDSFEDMEILRELEEILKPHVADYGDMESRVCWNRYLLKHAPMEVKPHIYENMFFLCLTNYQLWEAEHILTEMKGEGLPVQTAWRYCIDIMRRPQRRGCYGRFAAHLPSYWQKDQQSIRCYPQFRFYCFGMQGKEILLPVRILMQLFLAKREKELSHFKKVYLVYAGIISLQKSLYSAEDALFRSIHQWIRGAENVALCAPSLLACSKERLSQKKHSPERIQMDAFAGEHPQVQVLFPEFAQSRNQAMLEYSM